MTSRSTPATLAGIAFISTDDGGARGIDIGRGLALPAEQGREGGFKAGVAGIEGDRHNDPLINPLRRRAASAGRRPRLRHGTARSSARLLPAGSSAPAG